jgi:hypothetical protein
MSEPTVDIILTDIDSLRGHEEVIPDNLERRINKLLDKGFYKPIIVDRESLVILDGHHKWTAAEKLGLGRVPVVMVDYLDDFALEVGVWPDCGRDAITKEEVLTMGFSEEVFPPKTSRHLFPFRIPSINIPLEELTG